MRFSDVIGQNEVKQQIARLLRENRLPHALLFDGPEGSGKLAMALALANRLLCTQPTPEGEPCGACKGCRMAAQLAHPDLHFVYPVYKPEKSLTPPVSTLFIDEWRKQVMQSPYFSRMEWLKAIGVEKQQCAKRKIDETIPDSHESTHSFSLSKIFRVSSFAYRYK